jgi:hypothetical protein
MFDSGPFAIFVCGNFGLSLPIDCTQPNNPESGLYILNRPLLWNAAPPSTGSGRGFDPLRYSGCGVP